MAVAATEIEKLVIRLVGDATSYQKMLRDAATDTKKAESIFTRLGVKLKSIGTSMTSAGRSMSMAFTVPLAIIGGASVRAFAQFDSAMTQSTSIMKVTEAQIKSMRETALSMSTSGEFSQAPKEMAASYFFLASAGKDAAQSIALLPTVSRFATAGQFDMALATDLLTDAQSALGLSSKDVAQDQLSMLRVSDVLVKANTLANASVQQFSTSLTTKAGAALKSYNKDVEEGVAVLAALADQGVKSELAGNALDRFMRLSAKGAIDNAEAHKELGFEVFDANGKMRNLGDIIGNLEQVLEGLSDEERAVALDMMGFEARVQGVILPLIGTSKAIKQYEKELRNAGGTTKDVADKQMKSFSNQMKVFRNQLTAAAIEIGETMAPILMSLTEYVKNAIKWWKSLSEETRKFIIVTAMIVGVVGPILVTLGILVTAIGAVIGAIGLLGGAVLASPIGLLVGLFAIVLVGAIELSGGIGNLPKVFKNVAQTVSHLWDVMEGYPVIGKVVEALKEFNKFNKKGGVGADLGGGIGESFAALKRDVTSGISHAKKPTKLVGGISADRHALQKELWASERARVANQGIGEGAHLITAEKMGSLSEDEMQNLIDKNKELQAVLAAGGEIPETKSISTYYRDLLAPAKEWLAFQEKIAVSENAIKVAQAERLKEVTKEADTYRKSLEAEVKYFWLEGRDREMAQLEDQGISGEQLWKLDRADRALTKLENEKQLREDIEKLQEEGIALTEQHLTKQEKYDAEIEYLNKLLNAQAISQETFDRAKAAAQKTLGGGTQTALVMRDAVTQGSRAAEERLAEYRAASFKDPRIGENKAPEERTAKGVGDMVVFTKQMVGLLQTIAGKEPGIIPESEVAGIAP